MYSLLESNSVSVKKLLTIVLKEIEIEPKLMLTQKSTNSITVSTINGIV